MSVQCTGPQIELSCRPLLDKEPNQVRTTAKYTKSGNCLNLDMLHVLSFMPQMNSTWMDFLAVWLSLSPTMPASIPEHEGKVLLGNLVPQFSVLDSTGTGSWDEILERNPWLATTNLVAKPDSIKHRGHGKAIAVENKSFEEAKKWVMDKMCEEKMNFLIEPFCRSHTGTGALHLHEVLHLSRKIILANLHFWYSKMQPLSGNQRPDLPTSLMNMSFVLRLPRKMHLCRSSSDVPCLPSLFEMLQDPHVLLTFDKLHNLLHLPRDTVRRWCVLYILASKCASRHNGVHFFDISTSKSGPRMVCSVHFDLEMCFAPQPRALFRHRNFQKWSDAGVFYTFWPRNVLRATTACTFSTSQLPKVVRECGVLCTFWHRNVLRATTACNFSSLIWPAGSAPAALAYFSTLRSPKSLEKHSVSRLSYLFTHLHLLSSYSSFF